MERILDICINYANYPSSVTAGGWVLFLGATDSW